MPLNALTIKCCLSSAAGGTCPSCYCGWEGFALHGFRELIQTFGEVKCGKDVGLNFSRASTKPFYLLSLLGQTYCFDLPLHCLKCLAGFLKPPCRKLADAELCNMGCERSRNRGQKCGGVSLGC